MRAKPVRLIVPFPPGGANDIVARLIGQRLNDRWARVVVIDNRAGAGGKYLVVSYTERSDRIRLISARQMNPRERKAYEQ